MWAVVIAGAGLALAAVVLLFPGTASASVPEASKPKPSPLPDKPDTTGKTLAEIGGATAAALGASAGIVAAGTAYVAANAFVGGQLTGDIGGTIAGGVLGVYGNAGNVGRVVGKEVDQLLGGGQKGSEFTSAVAQAGGFSIGYVWAVFGGLAAIGIFSVFAPLYLIGSAISDLARLGFGQKGAREDYDKQWNDARLMFQEKLAGMEFIPGTKIAWSSDANEKVAQVVRFSWPLADGYARHTNRLAYQRWMSQAWGITVTTWYGHGTWGVDRGYFAGTYSGNNDAPSDEPRLNCWSDPYIIYLTAVPAGTAQTVSYNEVLGYVWRLVPKQPTLDSDPEIAVGQLADWKQPVPPDWVKPWMLEQDVGMDALGNVYFHFNAAPPLTLKHPEGLEDGIVVDDYFDVVMHPHMGTKTGKSDLLAPELVKAGELVANTEAWKLWNLETHGAFVNDIGHAQWGLTHGRFMGAVEEGEGGAPVMLYMGRRFDKSGALMSAAEVSVPEAAPTEVPSLAKF